PLAAWWGGGKQRDPAGSLGTLVQGVQVRLGHNGATSGQSFPAAVFGPTGRGSGHARNGPGRPPRNAVEPSGLLIVGHIALTNPSEHSPRVVLRYTACLWLGGDLPTQASGIKPCATSRPSRGSASRCPRAPRS